MNTEDYETGTHPNEMILPDRLTHITHKGADHPSDFAKGCLDDSTPGGVYYSPASTRTEELAVVRRVFADDSALAFEAREEFSGRREGFVFRLGSKGLGYYEDRFVFRLGSKGLGYYEDRHCQRYEQQQLSSTPDDDTCKEAPV
jgi:hypothetical protein